MQLRYRGKKQRELLRRRVQSIVRLQRAVKRVATRRKWAQLLEDVAAYAGMVARRDAVLRKYHGAGSS